MKNGTWMLALAAALAACGTESPVAPTPDATMGRGSPNGAQAVTVMQQNMYVGADVDAIIRAIAGQDEDEIAQAIGQAIATLQNTDIVARAGAIADQIAKTRPHVVGLQEVSTIAVGPMTIPFLGILQAALAARGLNYGVCEHENFTVAVAGVSLTDADALLYDRDRMTSVACGPGGAFDYQIGFLGITRGWGSLTGVVNGSTHTFVVTHLESGNDPGLDDLRTMQAIELVATFEGASPVTLLGDFNAFPSSDAYGVLMAAGYTDLWAVRHPGAVGYTCCLAADLSNKVAKFDQRIDYIFARDLPTQQGQTLIIGNTPGARVPGPSYPIWPSDHAGLIGTFLAPAVGTK